MKQFLNRYKKDEEGAVTVDWVVLTAGIAGLAVVAYLAIEENTNALAADATANITAEIGK